MEAVLVGIEDAGRALGVGKSTTYNLIRQGHLKTVQIGRRNLVRADSIRALMDAGTIPGRNPAGRRAFAGAGQPEG